MLPRRISDRLQVIGIIDPDAYTAAEYLTGAIDMNDYHSVMAIAMAGDLGASATLDLKAQDSATSGGTYADISGKAITQLTQAGTDSNKQAILNLRSDELNSGARYVKFAMTVATATSDAGLIVLGFPRYSTEADLAAVDEIV
jgi:hypothetical protein